SGLRDGMPEAMDWVEQIMPRSAAAPAEVRGRLLILRALLAGSFNNPAPVTSLWEEGCRLLPDDADHAYDRGLAAYAGIFAALADGSIEDALRRVEEGIALSVAQHQELGLAFMGILGAG